MLTMIIKASQVLSKKTREIVEQLLKAQNKIRQNKQFPKEIKNIQLISQEELDEIRKYGL